MNTSRDGETGEKGVGKLVTPVFGKGVAYDVPNNIFLEQKKMLKTGLTQAHFRRYVSLIEAETIEYFKRWGDRGERGWLTSHIGRRDPEF